MNDVKKLKYLVSNALKDTIDTLLNASFHQNKPNTGGPKLLSR